MVINYNDCEMNISLLENYDDDNENEFYGVLDQIK